MNQLVTHSFRTDQDRIRSWRRPRRRNEIESHRVGAGDRRRNDRTHRAVRRRGRSQRVLHAGRQGHAEERRQPGQPELLVAGPGQPVEHQHARAGLEDQHVRAGRDAAGPQSGHPRQRPADDADHRRRRHLSRHPGRRRHRRRRRDRRQQVEVGADDGDRRALRDDRHPPRRVGRRRQGLHARRRQPRRRPQQGHRRRGLGSAAHRTRRRGPRQHRQGRDHLPRRHRLRRHQRRQPQRGVRREVRATAA